MGYSVQYCRYNHIGQPGDFDIFEKVADLPNDHYKAISCDGFGFVALGKNEKGEVVVLFRFEGKKVVFVTYSELLDRFFEFKQLYN